MKRAENLCARTALALMATLMSGAAVAAANIVIVNADGPGEGFNDPSPVAPVGGNPGETLGAQRLNAFAYAASLWGNELDSSTTIEVVANFDPLSCTATSAVLGSAGARYIHSDFPGAPLAGTWYSEALANKIAGSDQSPGSGNEDIGARFNSNLGNADCLAGSPFYLGLDNNPPPGQVNLVIVLLHEFAHGLGFQTFTSRTTGAEILGLPSIYDYFLYDNSVGKTWVEMSDAERVASAVNPRNVVWAGANVTAAAPAVLVKGTPELEVLAPARAGRSIAVGAASFGPPLSSPGVTKQVMPVIDDAGFLDVGCAPFNAENTRRAKDRIAVVVRGACAFVTKVKNAQDAGAVGVLVIDNVAGGPPAGMGGTDPSITIPSVRITLADGIQLLGSMSLAPSNRSSELVVRLGVDTSQLAGADSSGRVLMYTPNPYQSGSSVAHWDTSAFRNLLMEPAINSDLTPSVRPPEDLTLPMFRDLGW